MKFVESPLSNAVAPDARLADLGRRLHELPEAARVIAEALETREQAVVVARRNLRGARVDPAELPVLFALQKEGIKIVDGQQIMQNSRILKTQDEITLLNTACTMVDVAYDRLYESMRPGVRENELVLVFRDARCNGQ